MNTPTGQRSWRNNLVREAGPPGLARWAVDRISDPSMATAFQHREILTPLDQAARGAIGHDGWAARVRQFDRRSTRRLWPF